MPRRRSDKKQSSRSPVLPRNRRRKSGRTAVEGQSTGGRGGVVSRGHRSRAHASGAKRRSTSSPAASRKTTRPSKAFRARQGGARTWGKKFGAAARLLQRLGKPVAICLLVGVVVYGGLMAHQFVVESPHFHVKRVDVSPTVHVSAAEVRRLAGIRPQTNIFSVDLAAVARRVQRHPWVASAKVNRRMPNAIRIQIVEHQAAAAVLFDGTPTSQSAFYLVNAQGKAFKRASLAELKELPLITGISRKEYLKHGEGAKAQVREALGVVQRYHALAGRPPVGEIRVDPLEGITLYTARRAIQVRLGRGGVSAKLRRLDRVWRELARRGQHAEAIRLDNERHPRRVTVRLAEVAVGGADSP